MFWLFLLGAVTSLIIVLRRVLRRLKPMNDELYSSRVAIDHVQSGVAWIRADGKLGSVNQSLTESLGLKSTELVGVDWLKLFANADRDRASQAYSQMLLQGKTWFDARGARKADAAPKDAAWLDVLLVAVHDHRMRFVGHHCLIRDCTAEIELEARLLDEEASMATAR